MSTWATGFLETYKKKGELRLQLKSYSVVFMGKSRLCHFWVKRLSMLEKLFFLNKIYSQIWTPFY